MKLQIATIFFIFTIFNLNAQVYCLPDSLYRDSTVGVYPRPVTPENPNGGITKPACINKPYEFVLTIKIPDTVSFQGIVVNLNSAKIETTGAIQNLPVGITYACNPPDCVFPKLSLGCIKLYGTATSANLPGKYKPVITLNLSTAFGTFPISYPGAQFPGEYILTLLDESCQVGLSNPSEEKQSWFPNPSNGNFHTTNPNVQNIKLYNSFGQMVYSNFGSTRIDVENQLNSGLYFIHWFEGEKSYTQKMWIKND
ncbi:MAG: T9SS type A sorting domain-containing protein [Saprospiraceae bacterium]